MTVSRVKTWISETLTASDLNAEFNNILNAVNNSKIFAVDALTLATNDFLQYSGTAWANKTPTQTLASLMTGGQIPFPAVQASSSNANTLDDYEEGTWTPTDASGAALTFSVALGRYTKIGSLVTFSAAITFPVTANANSVQFDGLPFTASNAIAANMDGATINNTDSARLDVLSVSRNTTQILLRNTSNSGVANSVYSAKSLSFHGFYTATA